MAVLGALNVAFTATTDKFSKGVSVIERGLKRIAALVTSTKALLVGGLGLLGVGLGAAAFTGFLDGQMEAIDNLAKLSDRLGVSTEMLAAMQLQADLAGVSADEFATNIERLVKNIGNVAIEGGELQDTFTRLGLKAKDLANIAPDEGLFRIADAFQKINNPGEQHKIAGDLFGKAGIKMINVLKEGREGFMAAGKEAIQFGLAVSRIDAGKVEAANDAITRVKAVFTGIGRVLAVEISPWIEAVAVGFTNWVKDIGGVEAVVLRVQSAVLDFGAQFLGVIKEIAIAFEDAFRIRNSKVTDKISANIVGLKERRNAVDDRARQAFLDANDPVQKLAKAADDAAKKIGKLPDAFEGMDKMARELAEAFKSPMEKFRSEIDKLLALRKAGKIKDNLFNLAAFDQRKKLVDAIGGDRFQAAGALEFGSGEAVNELNRVQTETQLTLDQVLEEAKKQTALQQKIADNGAKEILAVLQIN